jgi:PAS domain S-box-containing protein
MNPLRFFIDNLLGPTGLLKLLSVAALYALLAKLVLAFFSGNGVVSVVWPPSGFALAVLLMGGKRYAAGVYLGALLANAMTGLPLGTAAFIATGNTLEALLGAWLLTRDGKFDPDFRSLSDYLRLIVLAGFFSTIVSAINGSTTLLVSGFLTSEAYLVNLLHWWMGDAIGILLIAPFVLVWRRVPRDWIEPKRAIEVMLVLGLTFLIGQVVFHDWFHDTLGTVARGYWMFLLVTWAAVRLGNHGVVALILMVAAQALIGAAQGTGFFDDDMAKTQLTNYWSYMVTLSITGMALATHIAERKRAESEVFAAQSNRAATLDALPDLLFELDLDGYFHDYRASRSELLAVPPEVFLGKTMHQVLPRDAADEAMAALREAHETGRSSGREIELQVPQGKSWFELSVARKPVVAGAAPRFIMLSRDITERKARIQELQRWRDIFEHAEWGVVVGSADGATFELMNPAFARMHGYSVEELTGRPIAGVFAPECRETLPGQIQLAHQRGHYSFESWHLRKDGTVFPVLVDITTVRGAGGQVLHRIVNVRDITEQRRAEQALRESEMLYRSVVTAMDEGMVLHMASGDIATANPAAERILGMPQEGISGHTSETIPLETLYEDGSSFPAELHPAMVTLRTGEPQTNVVMGLRRPGSATTWISINSQPVVDSDKDSKPYAVVATFRDITEHKGLEEELLYRENKFRTLAENSPNIIIRYDQECRRVYANPAYARKTGVAVEDAPAIAADSQRRADMGIPAEEYEATLRRVMDTGTPAEMFLEWHRPDTGHLTSHAFQVVAERGPDGRVLGALAIGHNITALKEAEKRLEESYGQLRGLAARLESVREEERKRIARDMHDELGQYLTALRLGISVLRMRAGEKDPAILEQVRSLSTLGDKTMQVARDIAASLRPAPLELGVVSALEWLAEEFSKRTGVSCELETDEEEIDLDDEHSTAIFRMVQESLTNVTRHAEASQVGIRLMCQGEDYIVEVNDNGKGFDPSVPKAKSFGLVGLRERAIMLGGEVAIFSAPQRGTRITVRIPVPTAEREA